MSIYNEPNVITEIRLNKIVIVSVVAALLLGIIFFIFSNLAPSEKTFAAGVTRYAVASGNWNSTSIWSATSGGSSGASIPVEGDVVIIGESSTARSVTIPAGYKAACSTITIGSGSFATANSLSLSDATAELNVGGNLTINRSSGATTNALNVNAGKVSVGGILTMAGTNTTSTRIVKIYLSTGTLTVTGNLVVIAGTTTNNKIDMGGGAGTLSLGGSFNAQNCGFTKGTGTVVYIGTVAQTINFPTAGYYNLAIKNSNSAVATLSTAITSTLVSGNLSVGDGLTASSFATGNYAISLSNSKTLTVADGSTMNAGSSIIAFGTSATASINGVFQTANTAGFSGSTSTVIKSTNSPTISLGSNSNIQYTASSTQTITARTDYDNLSLTSGSKIIGSGTVTLSKDLVIETGASYLGSTNNPRLNIGGNFTNNGTFTQGSGLVTFIGSGTQIIGGTSPTTFDSLTINNTYVNSPQIALETNITINSALTLTDGIISLEDNNIVMASGSTLFGGSSSAFVYTGNTGVFKWMSCTANSTKFFPVGLNPLTAGYSPVALTFNSSHTTDNFSLRVDSVITTNGTKTGTAITANIVKAMWNITEDDSGGSNVDIKFQWSSTRELSVNRNKPCQLLHYRTSWERPSGQKENISGNTTATIIYYDYNGTFSPFGIEGDDGSVQLNFTGTPSISGTPGNVGAKYTWNNVGTAESVTIKAVIEIIGITGGASLETIDQSELGSNEAWQPIVNGSQTNGNCWGIEFRVRFYNASTNARLTLSSFKAQGIDIDGDASKVREYNTFDNPASYSVESNTTLTITSSPPHIIFKGPVSNVPDIDLTETKYIASCNYTNTDSLTIKLGGCCDGGNCATFSGTRLHSINFYDAVPFLSPLPVVMIYFNTEIKGEAAVLSWATASEINNSHFEVQRSGDAKSWTQIGRIEGNGNSSEIIKYDFTDDKPFQLNYYRLKQVDYDGKYEYSKTKVVDFASAKITIQAYPNPTSGELTLDITRTSVADGIQIEIMDIAGTIVKEMKFDPDGNQNFVTPVDISFCKKGLYIVRVTSGQKVQTYKITKL
jgi:hypothetical protein